VLLLQCSVCHIISTVTVCCCAAVAVFCVSHNVYKVTENFCYKPPTNGGLLKVIKEMELVE
jgi:hypothetical protein